MSQASVPISQRTQEVLQEIARAEHESVQVVLERAVEDYRRKRFLEEVNADYASLRQDREAWDSLESERAEWDAVLGDGLPAGEDWGRLIDRWGAVLPETLSGIEDRLRILLRL